MVNLYGLLVGALTFLIIGAFHPLVIKGYYYLGMSARWYFLALGLVSLTFSLIFQSLLVSSILGVVSFSSFWSIKEIHEQRERVRKGWFPDNPNRRKIIRQNDSVPVKEES